MEDAGTASGSTSSCWSLLMEGVGAVWGSLLHRLGIGLSLEATGSTAPTPGFSLEASRSIASTPIPSVFTKPPRKLNDSVYEVHHPISSLSMEILFFHGLQFDDSSNKHFWSTWESVEGSCIWPEKWLVEDFPGAKVAFISYDGALTERKCHSCDLYIIIENLIYDIIIAGAICQQPNRPVILVGHCFGGLIIKELCLCVRRKISLVKSETEKKRLQTFLDNVKGIFYYNTPHHGIPFLDKATYVKHDPLLAYFRTLSKDIARLNQEFSQLCELYAWHIHGLGASLKTRLSLFQNIIIVPESNGRDGEFFNVVENADHFTICKPINKISRSFYALSYLLEKVSRERQMEIAIHKCHGIPKHCPGLEYHAFIVQEMLTTSNVVGIVGMGGIGKTTISKCVFNYISREFEYSCFVDNVKAIPSYNLEDQLLSQFYHKGIKVDQKDRRWSQLMKRTTLIVLDDVDSEDQLKILPDLDDFGEGSRLIITSRDQGVLKIFEDYEVYDVEFLRDDEARDLLCHYAFGKEGLPRNQNVELEQRITEVVYKCQGLPLTLEVAGCYLRGHHNRLEFWDQTILQLEEAQGIGGGRNDRVWASLRVSFDSLLPEEQEMFIEAGTYFYMQPVERALAAWSTAYGRAETRWENLLSRCMVKEFYNVDDGFDEHDIVSRMVYYSDFEHNRKTVWVHEHLRDLAKSLQEVNMISARDDEVNRAVDLLNADGVNRETSMVRLSYTLLRTNVDRKTLQLESLEKLEKLKYLELDSVPHGGTWKNSPRRLCLLKWTPTNRLFQIYDDDEDEKALSLLPINLEELNNLAVLELEEWKVPKELPRIFGNLLKLRILSLRRLKGLTCLTNDFGNLSGLKYLELNSLKELKELGDSFRNLSALKGLLVHDCPSIERLPGNFGHLCALENLYLGPCGRLRELPESFGQLVSLNMLQICFIGDLEALPENFTGLISLQVLALAGFTKLKLLPESLGELASLRDLFIDSRDLVMLPKSLGKLALLEKLYISSKRLQSLPESLGDLHLLKNLGFWYVHSLRNLPEELRKLSSLQKLSIHYADVLESLPELENLSSLEILDIKECPELKYLPDSLFHVPSLREVQLVNCYRLNSLPVSLGKRCSPQPASLQGDRSTQLRNSEEGQSSQTTAMEGVRLRVCRCGYLLDESALERLGWEVESGVDPDGSSGTFSRDVWYRRKRPSNIVPMHRMDSQISPMTVEV